MKKALLAIGAIIILVAGYYLYIYWALGNDSVTQPEVQAPAENDSEILPSASEPSLTGEDWRWQRTLINDGREVVPVQPGKFVLSFKSDSQFSATTDCNLIGGTYEASDGRITFTNLFSTKMYCESSQEITFSEFLRDTTGYHFGPDGELILDLKFDSGSVVFR